MVDTDVFLQLLGQFAQVEPEFFFSKMNLTWNSCCWACIFLPQVRLHNTFKMAVFVCT
jgi:hypothetical protein